MQIMSLSLVLLLSLISIASCQKPTTPYTNTIDDSKMLLVIAVPSIHNSYYADVYDAIIAFDIQYAKSVMGKDNIVVLGDAPSINYLKQHLPKDILLEQTLEDIWLRDCSTVMPYQPTQFRYAAAAQGSQVDADFVQAKFNTFAHRYGLQFSTVPYILDGGNFVDNYNGKAIVSDRFLTDNNLTYTAAKTVLKNSLGLDQIAIIPNDDPNGLAHADGQVMFIDNNTIALTAYNDPHFEGDIRAELLQSFPGIKLITIPTKVDTTIWDPNFSSSCGIHINSTVTQQYLYLPTFGTDTDQQALQLVQDNTTKIVVPVDASAVCQMGGSLRCLSWQVVGDNAKKIIEAARK
ncbi:agmatine deiminase family protein [Aureispira anguillae]|uniref:Agmatine deiminase family protein n=2 Tax=Aureispira anguillae TaxID=2864201 RepID=A0A915YGT8_9BACT|nr:agmatine deiminase family protein [Aureispira anguillae]